MTDRPIIFSGPMVRALLAGTKTQTRRVLRLQPIPFPIDDRGTLCDVGCLHAEGEAVPRVTLGRVVTTQKVPYAAGDRLWVRETWAVGNIYDGVPPSRINPTGKPGWCGIRYAATDARLGIHDRPSIHMPRWASRLTLDVTEVRVQRLQDISEEDARAEGIRLITCLERGRDGFTGTGDDFADTRVEAFRNLWTSLHGPDAWAANPFVVAIRFTVTPANIDSLPEVPHG